MTRLVYDDNGEVMMILDDGATGRSRGVIGRWLVVAWVVFMVVLAGLAMAGCMTAEQAQSLKDKVAASADAKLAAIQAGVETHAAQLELARQVVAGAAMATEPLSPEFAEALKYAQDILSDTPGLIAALEQDRQSVAEWKAEQTVMIDEKASAAARTATVITGVVGLGLTLLTGGTSRWLGVIQGAGQVASTIAKARSADPNFNAAFTDDGSHAVQVMKKALAMAPPAVSKAVAKANNEYPPIAVEPIGPVGGQTPAAV